LYIVGTYTLGELEIHINGAFYSIDEVTDAIEFYKNR
jgi:hypothetical protein